MRGIKIIRAISAILMLIGTVLLLFCGTGTIVDTDTAMTVLFTAWSTAVAGLFLFVITAIINLVNQEKKKDRSDK
ncbi:MAG: hypothetical protein J6B51_06805 [Clostridia bacterium]|nr:hypothetical protein [Clostridia bacterium]MBO5299769.1 hypothetical protein [Clostridia bacterium]